MNPSTITNQRVSRASRVFLQDVLKGLRAPTRQISSKYFYDRRGSELFDRICELDEYYPTRTELAITEQYAEEMGQHIGEGAMLVEYGSGSSVKTRYLLDSLPNPAAYVPVDISGEHLRATAANLAVDYPRIEILPVCADFTEPFELPKPTKPATHAAVYFPGSTIGNFMPEVALRLLKNIATLCGRGGGLLIGIDLKKDISRIEAAYNDAEGVTAEFNLNLLRRINHELGADFKIKQFRHRARYNPEFGRIETDIVSLRDQQVTIDGEVFDFDEGSSIRTECSHKYTIEQFAEIAAPTGLKLHYQWTDPGKNFAVLHLVIE